MDFRTLKGLVLDFIGKEFANRVEYFINSGQKVLERKLRLEDMAEYPTAVTLADGVNSFTVPTDYLEMIYFTIIDGTSRYIIKERESDLSMIEFNRNHKADTTNTGRPIRIRRAGSNFEFDRYTDKATYSYEWAYYKNLTVLTDASDTNWWTLNASDVLLYAALMESIPFLTMDIKSAREVKVWAVLFKEKLEDLRISNSKSKLSGGRKRTRYHD